VRWRAPHRRNALVVINHAEGIASVDLFVVPNAFSNLPYGLVILAHERRRQIGFGVCLIGSIRREGLDHVVVFGEAHLCRVLKNYASCYNQVRTHPALDKDVPEFRYLKWVGNIRELPLLDGALSLRKILNFR
jgi:hypothetical protein